MELVALEKRFNHQKYLSINKMQNRINLESLKKKTAPKTAEISLPRSAISRSYFWQIPPLMAKWNLICSAVVWPGGHTEPFSSHHSSCCYKSAANLWRKDLVTCGGPLVGPATSLWFLRPGWPETTMPGAHVTQPPRAVVDMKVCVWKSSHTPSQSQRATHRLI